MKKQKELLTEIELLKKPPLTTSNKENLKENAIVKEIIKEVFVQNLEKENEELSLNLTHSEKTKLNNLSLPELENYKSQLIKSKFKHLENQLITNQSKEKERAKIFWL